MLFLMRHGEAGWAALTDESRTLTDRGVAFVRQQAATYQKPLESVVRIVASPFMRTQQTAKLMQECLSQPVEIITDARITPDSSIPDAVTALEENWPKEDDESLLVITHQPLIGLLTSHFVNGHIFNPFPYDPGQLSTIDMLWPGSASGIIQP
jgi:phosphohistidine phosphatase